MAEELTWGIMAMQRIDFNNEVIMKVEFEHNLETLYEVTNQRLKTKTFSLFRKLHRLGFFIGPLLGILLWKLGVVKIEINNNRLVVLELCGMIIIVSLLWLFL